MSNIQRKQTDRFAIHVEVPLSPIPRFRVDEPIAVDAVDARPPPGVADIVHVETHRNGERIP